MLKQLEKYFPTLGIKITTSVSLLLIAIGIGYFYYAHKTGFSVLEQVAQAKAHGVADIGYSILTEIMMNGKVSQLEAALEAGITSRHASEISIYDRHKNLVLFASPRGNTPDVSLKRFGNISEGMKEKFLPVTTGGSHFLYILKSIEKKPGCVSCHPAPEKSRGFLLVKVPTDEIRIIARDHRAINIAMVLITFLGLGGAILLTLRYIVIRPIKGLQGQIQDVEEKAEGIEQGRVVEFPQSTHSRGHDEIAMVTISFNRLVGKLNDAHKKLQENHNAQLTQADKMATVGEMAASLAHEIRNPIAGVLGALQVFSKDVQKSDPRRSIINEMVKQLERINRTISDLLNYSRPATPSIKKLKLNELIQTVLLLLKSQCERKNIFVEASLDSTLPDVHGDARLLHQVFWNVCLNAIHAIDESGNITVETSQSNGSVIIRLLDSGKGISVENQEKLFKPFFTTKTRGTGLGLTICRRIVEQHDGTISIESVQGRGTLITIVLPIRGDAKK